MNLGIIDIGSNAIRLYVVRVSASTNDFTELVDERFPLRLGEDVFTGGHLQPATIEKLHKVMIKFKASLDHHQVSAYKAVATSAMRNAANAKTVIDQIYRGTGIQISVISGADEAKLIHSAVTKSIDFTADRGLIMDIGGGSVEFIFCDRGHLHYATSLKLGTVRILKLVASHHPARGMTTADEIRQVILEALAELNPLKNFLNTDTALFAATGGNVKSLAKIMSPQSGSETPPLINSDLQALEKRIFSLTPAERVKKLGIRTDRADVIAPAIVLINSVMEFFNLRSMLTPKAGLKTGLVFALMTNAQVTTTR